MNQKKRLLFVSYFYPPSRAVASVRTGNIALHLARRGWDVTVVTPEPESWTGNLEDKQCLADACASGVKYLHINPWFGFLDPGHLRCGGVGRSRWGGGVGRRVIRWAGVEPQVGWLLALQQKLRPSEAAKANLMLVSGSPFLTFPFMARLAGATVRPLVVDYRDLWTAGNPHGSFPHRDRRRERAVLQAASAVITISQGCAVALDEVFSTAARTRVITNGFNAAEMDRVKATEFPEPAVVYAGNFYPPKRVITPIFEAMREMDSREEMRRQSWRFHYYGRDASHVQSEMMRHRLQNRVVIHGEVPRSEVLAATRGATVAIVITSVETTGTAADRGIVTGKIFEIAGLGAAMLLIAPPGSDADEIVRSTGAGYRASGENIAGIATFLSESIVSKKAVPQRGSCYEWGHLADRMEKLFSEVIEASESVRRTPPTGNVR